MLWVLKTYVKTEGKENIYNFTLNSVSKPMILYLPITDCEQNLFISSTFLFLFNLKRLSLQL